MKTSVFIIGFAILLVSCSQRKSEPLSQALEFSGANRVELEAVLEHYKNDSLKLKAARFLIENMPYHFSRNEYFVSPEGEKYRPDITLFDGEESVKKHCDSLLNRGYRIKNEIDRDILSVDSQFLIENIELAFSVWQKPWAKDVPFIDFCRYILPYRSQTEMITTLRKEMMERFIPVLDSADVTTSLDACILLNDRLKDILQYKGTGAPFYPTIDETYRAGFSQCEGMCNLGTFIMRAVGIPVAVDQTTWVKMDLGHSWCAVLDQGRFYSFGPGEDQPGMHGQRFSQLRRNIPAKVYRLRFDPVFSPVRSKDDGYKTALKNPLMCDVTAEYPTKPATIQVYADKGEGIKNSNQVYLCTYNHYNWLPIALGYRENALCHFKDVVGDNIFVVADSPDGFSLRHITDPFYVDPEGIVRKLIPRIHEKHSYTFQKRLQKRNQEYTLYYWNTQEDRFISLEHTEETDSTKSYDNIPGNAMLRFTIPERVYNQRMCLIEKDSLLLY